MEALERITSRHLRKWLGVPPSLTSIGLYGKTNKLQLPLSSLVEEFKVPKSRLVLTLRDSPDELIRDAGIETRTSRKWSATEAVKQAENTLKHNDIVGVTAVGRHGIGATQFCGADQTKRRGVDPVRSKESRGTCKTSKGRRDGSTGSMDYVEHHRQGANLWRYLEV